MNSTPIPLSQSKPTAVDGDKQVVQLIGRSVPDTVGNRTVASVDLLQSLALILADINITLESTHDPSQTGDAHAGDKATRLTDPEQHTRIRHGQVLGYRPDARQ